MTAVDLKDRTGLKLLPVLLASTLKSQVQVAAAVCPWCEAPRRCDKTGYFHQHRARRVKGWMRGGRPRIYVARDECRGSGERPGETRAWDET